MCLGIPGKIVEIQGSDTALVDVSGIKRAVNITCVNTSNNIHDLLDKWVLVHVGFAMSVIDAEEAAKTLALIENLGEMQENLAAFSGAQN